MQGICAGAAIDVYIVIDVGATLVVTYVMPSVLFTGLLVISVVGAVIDSEVERVNVSAR